MDGIELRESSLNQVFNNYINGSSSYEIIAFYPGNNTIHDNEIYIINFEITIVWENCDNNLKINNTHNIYFDFHQEFMVFHLYHKS